MLTAKDINNIVRWAVDTDGLKFGSEIYQKDREETERDDYVSGKFRDMQDRFIHWVANLDNQNKQRLADAINNNPTNEVEKYVN